MDYFAYQLLIKMNHFNDPVYGLQPMSIFIMYTGTYSSPLPPLLQISTFVHMHKRQVGGQRNLSLSELRAVH